MKCPICESELPNEGLPTIARLKLKPGDRVIISCPQRLTDVAKANLIHCWQKLMPDVLGIVLDDGVTVQVITPEKKVTHNV